MAEHMLILKLTPPQGEPRYVTAAFPSACGKTNLAMLQPTIPAGRSRRSATTSPGCASATTAAVRHQPRGRLLRRRARHRRGHQRQRRPTFYGNSIFTNVALTDDGDVWWEGLTRSRRPT
jgi:phosphoenolpyruvate carboxykinase (GTP)